MAEIKLTGFKNGRQSTVGDTDTAMIDGSLTIGDDLNEDAVVFNAEINSDFIPDVDNSFDIGSETKVWSNVYASNGNFSDVSILSGAFEKSSNITNATGNTTMNCSDGHIFYLTSISGNFTPQFTNTNTSTSNFATSITLVLDQGNPAYIPNNTVSIDGSSYTVNWQGDVSPTGTVDGFDVVSYSIFNNGGTIIVLGQLVSFG